MSDLSNMYQRVGNLASSIDNRRPMNFACLVLPPARELRKAGLSDYAHYWGETRDHLYAKWEKHEFFKGCTVAEALAKIEEVNRSSDRIVKIRINFTDGTFITLERKVPKNPNSLRSTVVYNPSDAFRQTTEREAELERTVTLQKMQYLSNDDGHLLSRAPGPIHFDKQKLFADCPVATMQRPSFAFTPVSYQSYMVRPNYKIPGCRPHISDFNEEAVYYRPKGYNSETFLNPDEIDNKNHVNKERLSRAGDEVYSGSFLRTTAVVNGYKGAPIRLPELRNTAASGMSSHRDETGTTVTDLPPKCLLQSQSQRETGTVTKGFTTMSEVNPRHDVVIKKDRMGKYHLKKGSLGGGRGILVGSMTGPNSSLNLNSYLKTGTDDRDHFDQQDVAPHADGRERNVADTSTVSEGTQSPPREGKE